MSIEIKKEEVLIRPKDIEPSSDKFKILGTINPGAMRLPSKEILLYVRVTEKLIDFDTEKKLYSPRMIGEKKFKLKREVFSKSDVKEFSELDFSFNDGTKRLTFISHFRMVLLDETGLKVKWIDKKPSFYGLSWDGEFGVEDSRLVKIGENYAMTYVTLSREMNVSSSLAISNDCKTWFRRGIIFAEQNKDAVVFPEMINEQYLALNRPEGNFQFSSPDIILSYSKDLHSWGWPVQLKLCKKKDAWDSGRVGAGPPPIKTEKGWLLIYHGVIEKARRKHGFFNEISTIFGVPQEEHRDVYCVGAALLELENPKKVIAKSKHPIIYPKRSYERGTFESKDVVFPTGLVMDLNGKDVLLYSGGGDIVTTVKKISLAEIMGSLEKF